jgi:two-component system, NarL family, nitrate/nitrite response regulator NarL
MINSNRPPIRLLIVDDHTLVRAGLRTMIETDIGLKVVGEASNREEALEGARKRPDIILLDINLDGQTSLDFLPELLAAAKGSKVLIVTGVSDPQIHDHAVRLGATGIVHKVEDPVVLFAAIRKVHTGEVWLPGSMIARVLGSLTRPQDARSDDPEEVRIALLTAREREVIALIGEGLRNKQIADRLFISEPTVRHYLGSVFDKLDVGDRLGLIVYAYQHALAKLPPTRSKRVQSLQQTSAD